jgi:hypothetical protein
MVFFSAVDDQQRRLWRLDTAPKTSFIAQTRTNPPAAVQYSGIIGFVIYRELYCGYWQVLMGTPWLKAE